MSYRVLVVEKETDKIHVNTTAATMLRAKKLVKYFRSDPRFRVELEREADPYGIAGIERAQQL